MDPGIDLEAVSARIDAMRAAARELEALAGDNPCLACNLVRIRAGLKMLELGFSDAAELGAAD